MLVPLDQHCVVGRVHLGGRAMAIDAGHGEQLALDLGHEHHHGRARREPLGPQLLLNGRPYIGKVTGGRRLALEVYVSPLLP